MACNNGLFGGSCCTWIIILLILWIFCGDGGSALFGNNGCGCNRCDRCDSDDFSRSGCGCGC